MTYRWSNDILSTYSSHQSMYFLSGMVAGIVATGLTQPLEIVRAKKMAYTKRIIAGKNEQSIMQALREIKHKDGWFGFTRGPFPRLIRKPIINAATFFFYEVLSVGDTGKI